MEGASEAPQEEELEHPDASTHALQGTTTRAYCILLVGMAAVGRARFVFLVAAGWLTRYT
jgi:hypothetical protein